MPYFIYYNFKFLDYSICLHIPILITLSMSHHFRKTTSELQEKKFYVYMVFIIMDYDCTFRDSMF